VNIQQANGSPLGEMGFLGDEQQQRTSQTHHQALFRAERTYQYKLV
jgi:hypothetical protein